MHTAFAGLLPIFQELAPEIRSLDWPEESRATCASCAMVDPERSSEALRGFSAEVKCCTFHPYLPNYAVGALLKEGGDGARRIVSRLLQREDGIRLEGIESGESWDVKYRERGPTDFGTSRELLCPYWAGGEESCGIWRHRNAVCRTWFCRFEDGRFGFEQWAAARAVVGEIELGLARWCVDQAGSIRPPETIRHWVGWYLWCAEKVHEARPEGLAKLTELIEPMRAELVSRAAQRRAPLEDVVIPTVQVFERHGETAHVGGFSTYDMMEVPSNVFFFFSLLDGTRSWREAMEGARAECPWLDEAIIAVMWRRGVLGPASEGQ